MKNVYFKSKGVPDLFKGTVFILSIIANTFIAGCGAGNKCDGWICMNLQSEGTETNESTSSPAEDIETTSFKMTTVANDVDFTGRIELCEIDGCSTPAQTADMTLGEDGMYGASLEITKDSYNGLVYVTARGNANGTEFNIPYSWYTAASMAEQFTLYVGRAADCSTSCEEITYILQSSFAQATNDSGTAIMKYQVRVEFVSQASPEPTPVDLSLFDGFVSFHTVANPEEIIQQNQDLSSMWDKEDSSIKYSFTPTTTDTFAVDFKAESSSLLFIDVRSENFELPPAETVAFTINGKVILLGAELSLNGKYVDRNVVEFEAAVKVFDQDGMELPDSADYTLEKKVEWKIVTLDEDGNSKNITANLNQMGIVTYTQEGDSIFGIKIEIPGEFPETITVHALGIANLTYSYGSLDLATLSRTLAFNPA